MNEENEKIISGPDHYTYLKEKLGVEPYKMCELFDFNIGCAFKYLFRAGKKLYPNMSARESKIIDLQKAIKYLQFEIDKEDLSLYNEEISEDLII